MNENLADNVPGKSTREMAKRRFRTALVVVLLGAVVLVCLFFAKLMTRNLFVALLVIFGLWFVDQVVRATLALVKKREGDAARGARAEEDVGAVLNRLPAGTHVVLHDVAAEFGNIDHLVFRADGAVFLIETKAHQGKVTFEHGELRLNGHPFEKDILKQTHRNVYWLSNFLKTQYGIQVWVHAAMVFPNAYVTVRRTLRGVDIVNLKYLERWMTKAQGNREVVRKVWSHIHRLKEELRVKRRDAPG